MVAGGEKGWKLLISEVKCFEVAFEVRKRRSCSERKRDIVADCRRSRTEGAFTARMIKFMLRRRSKESSRSLKSN